MDGVRIGRGMLWSGCQLSSVSAVLGGCVVRNGEEWCGGSRGG